MEYPGRLVIVEGTDGSGKSTQIRLLKKWLEGEGYPVVFTEWNSSALVQAWTKKAKQQKQLTPTTFSLIHASDFFDRYERFIVPLLRAGFVVLADRYIYTAFARDVARGCQHEWVRNTYRSAITPTLALYFQAPLDVAVNRILSGRTELKYHEAGLDIGLSEDPVEAFQLFQGMIQREYDRMVAADHLTIIDATRPIHEQQTQVRDKVKQLLADYQFPCAIAPTASADAMARLVKVGDDDVAPLRFPAHGFPGKLFVIEGSDYSGHSAQSRLLTEWLEKRGHAVYEAGIKRSKLMRQAIDDAKEEHVVGPRTMGLFYATDFADQLENGIIPALRAGMVVVADRYVYTLMARQLVRGVLGSWLDELYRFALQPDAAFMLSVPEEDLARRCLQTYGRLRYWESGMDLALSSDPLDSLHAYQRALGEHYLALCSRAGVQVLDGTQSMNSLAAAIREQVAARL